VAEADAAPNSKSPWATFWIASVAVFPVGIDTSMLFAAFKAMRVTFPATSAADLSWVVNAYTAVHAGMLVPAGRFSDSRGRKKAFLPRVAMFVVASATCGLAGTVPLLIGARALQSVGAALLTPASLSIVLAAFSQEPAFGHRQPVGRGRWPRGRCRPQPGIVRRGQRRLAAGVLSEPSAWRRVALDRRR